MPFAPEPTSALALIGKKTSRHWLDLRGSTISALGNRDYPPLAKHEHQSLFELAASNWNMSPFQNYEPRRSGKARRNARCPERDRRETLNYAPKIARLAESKGWW